LNVNRTAVQDSSASAAGTASCVSMFVGHTACLRRGFSDCLLQLLKEPLHFVIWLHVAGRNHLYQLLLQVPYRSSRSCAYAHTLRRAQADSGPVVERLLLIMSCGCHQQRVWGGQHA